MPAPINLMATVIKFVRIKTIFLSHWTMYMGCWLEYVSNRLWKQKWTSQTLWQ